MCSVGEWMCSVGEWMCSVCVYVCVCVCVCSQTSVVNKQEENTKILWKIVAQSRWNEMVN